MLKRFTALLMIYVLFTGILSPSVFAAEPSAKEKKIDSVNTAEYDEYIGLMNALGIMEEDTEGYAEITRGEFAYYLSRTIFPDETLEGIHTDFTDCDGLSAAERGAIGYLELLGVVGGYSKTQFAPEDKISVDEAVKMTVSFIGYDEASIEKGGFPEGYRVIAKRFNLLDDISQPGTEYLTAASAAILLYNMLECEVLGTRDFIGSGMYNGKGIFREMWADLYAIEGLVCDNGKISLYGETEIPEDTIMVEDTLIRDYTGDDILGKRMKVYYRYEKKSGKNIFVYAMGHDELNNYESFWADPDLKYSDYEYEYYYDEYTIKSEKVKLESNFILIYNGKPIIEGIQFDEAYMMPDAGYIKLIDNDNDKQYDVVFVVDYQQTFVVEAVDSEDYVIFNENGDRLELNKNNTDYIFTDDTGMSISATDCMTKGTVLSVGESACKKGMVIVKRTVTVSGAVEKKADGKIFINGGMYEIAANYEPITVLGESGTFYLNEKNEIIWFIADTNKVLLGYVIAVRESGGYLNDFAQIKLLAEDGIVHIYDVRDKVKFDGSKIDAETTVQKLGETPQLVRFKIDEESKIYWLDTVEADTELTNSTLSIIEGVENVDLNYYKNAELLQGKAIVDSVTKIFLIPNDPSDETQFVVVNEDYFESSEIKCRNATAYTTDDTPYAVALVLKLDITGKDVNLDEACRTPYIVTEVYETINEEGQPVSEIVVNDRKGTAITVQTEAQGDLEFEATDGSIAEIGVGDVIRYGYNSKGKITKGNFLVVYDADAKRFYQENAYNYSATRYYADHLMQPVYAMNTYDEFVQFSFKDPSTEEIAVADKYLYPADKFTIFKYDSKNNKVTEADESDIISYKISPTEYSYGMIYLNYFNGGFCIIYR